MTNSNKNPANAGSDDPWEQLAEDLFGLDFGKEHSAGTSAAAPPPVSPPEPEPAVTFEPEPIAAQAVSEVASEEVLIPPATSEVTSPPAPSPQDSYWDALANWNWDDGEASGTRNKRSEGRDERRPGDRPRGEGRGAPAESRSSGPAPSAPRREPARSEAGPTNESIEPAWGDLPESGPVKSESIPQDDYFGATDDEEDDEDEVEAFGEEGADRPTESGEEGAPKKRRRRRRRRRSRSGDAEGGEPAATQTSAPQDVPGSDWGTEERVAPAAPRRVEEPRPAAAERGERKREEGRRDEDGGRRPRRRRGDRDRDRGRREPAPASAESSPPADDDFGTSPVDEILISSPGASPGDFDSDEDGVEPNVNYEDVPTWEEAISYLLHPSQVQVEPGPGNGGGQPRGAAPSSSSGDQPRQTRHYGGRRR